MTSLAKSAPSPPFDGLARALREGSPVAVAVVLVVWALATRAVVFGNPVIDHDDQFYVVVAGRMLHGALPYVDIWDRKPVGLFLLFAAMRMLGGDGIVEYQLVACAAVAATAFLIWRSAKPLSGALPALWAALLYVTYCLVFDGAAGQSAVFYNLAVLTVAILIVHARQKAAVGSLRGAQLAIIGAVAMLLVGVAIQIKYTVVFEGAFFGLALIWTAAGTLRSRGAVFGLAALWFASAMLPTAAAALFYYRSGHFDAFAQANFISIFYRHERWLPALGRLAATIIVLSPLLFWAWRGAHARVADEVAARRAFVVTWCAVALAAYLGFGTYYDHYALPLLPPLCILASLGAAARPGLKGLFATLGVALLLGALAVGIRIHVVGNARQLAVLSGIVRQNLHGCLFVYEGDSILYQASDACFVSHYVFPSHLNAAKEQGALEVDAAAETRRILAARPSVIVLQDRDRGAETNFTTRNIVTAALARDYRLAGWAKVGVGRSLVYRLAR